MAAAESVEQTGPFEGEISAVTGSVRNEGVPSMIGDLAKTPAEKKNQKHTPFAVLIYHGSGPICNEHLEGQRDDLPYVTAKVGNCLSSKQSRNLNAGVHTCSQHINLKNNIPVGPQNIGFDGIFVDWM